MATAEGNVNRKHRPRLMGVVVSDHRDKTIAVEFSYSVRHSKYGKYMRRTTRVHAHDEENAAHTGDRVELAFCRPISKSKSWRLLRIISRAPAQVGENAAAGASGEGDAP